MQVEPVGWVAFASSMRTLSRYMVSVTHFFFWNYSVLHTAVRAAADKENWKDFWPCLVLPSFTMRVGLYPSTSYPLHQDMAPSLLLNQLNNNNQARLVPHPQERRPLQQRVWPFKSTDPWPRKNRFRFYHPPTGVVNTDYFWTKQLGMQLLLANSIQQHKFNRNY